MIKKIAILASGGNSPAMNNAIITLVRKSKCYKLEVELVSDGYKGLVNNSFHEPNLPSLSLFYATGNVLIGTTRYPEFAEKKNLLKAVKNLKNHHIDCLFVIGGDGSYHGALELSKHGIKVVCLPGTIDNDIRGTEQTIGFSTALKTVVDNIDNLRDSFDSHAGVCLVEVMGRRFPDLTINAAIACEAEAIVTAAKPLTAKEIAKIAKDTEQTSHRSCLVVISEKVYGHDGLPTLEELTKQVADLLDGRMVRSCVLGYVQRGGVPTPEDRILAVRLASYALDAAFNIKVSSAVAWVNNQPTAEPLADILKQKKKPANYGVLKSYLKYNRY